MNIFKLKHLLKVSLKEFLQSSNNNIGRQSYIASSYHVDKDTLPISIPPKLCDSSR